MKFRYMMAAVAAAATLSAAAPTMASATAASHSADRQTCQNRRVDRLQAISLTADGQLQCVEEGRAGRPQLIGRVTGLTGDTALVGIDFRPANGKLYGLGNAGGIYTIDVSSAAATKVAQAAVALVGTSFGVDFNPVVDRLRVVSDTGQNLALNVDDGTSAAGQVALAQNGQPALGVTAAAYTNNDADADTATTLFDIDTVNDQVVVQSPAAGGVLVSTGKLGVDTGSVAGLDIFADQKRGTTVSNTALALVSDDDGRTGLARVDLLTGRAGKVSLFPAVRPVTDIAIPLDSSR